MTDAQKIALQQLQYELGLLPADNPFEYVKAIQKDFDGSKIQYSNEYYEVTGKGEHAGHGPDSGITV